MASWLPGFLASWPHGQGSTAPCEDPLSFVPTFAFQTYLAGWAFCGCKMDTLVISSPESLPEGSERGRPSSQRSLGGMANVGDSQGTWPFPSGSSVPRQALVVAGLLCLPRCRGHPAPFKWAQAPSWSGLATPWRHKAR